MNYPGSLHTHSEYSNLRLRDSLNKLEDLIDYSIELGHEVLAITEHDALCGHIRAEKYYNKIKEKNPNFKLIHGNEIYLVRNGLTSENFDRESDRYFHFILLAKDRVGHEQLERISTMAWNRSYVARRMRRVPTYYNDLISIIGEDKGHIIGSTACLGGYLPNMLLKYKDNPTEDNFDKILHWLTGMDNIFGHGNFFLEMQPSKNKEQIYVNEMILKLSEQLDIPYIITTDAHYLRKSDMSIHKAFLNAQNGDRETESFYATTYQMGTEEIESYMTLTREQLDKAYSNILKIKDMCEDYSLRQNLHIPYLPKDITEPDHNLYLTYKNQIPMLEKFYTSVYDSDRHLVRALINSIERDKQYQNKETYIDLNECLEYTWQSSEVNKSRWSAYFLNLADYIDIIWQSGSLVGCGRGSGVGFLLLNMLNITQINPLREQTATFKWRFLNPSRVSPLDVDIDIETSKRAQVIAALKQAYGEDRVSNVATFKTEKAKSAIQTAARGLGIDNDISAYLSSLVAAERGIQRTLSQTFYGDEENDIPANKTFVKEMTENYPELWELARRIEGLIVGVGQHAGGVIFTDKPFYKNTALMRAPKGDIITQYDLHDAEDAGLIKIDLLSVNALDRIHLCLDLLIKQEYVSPEPTLRETYEKVIGIYNLERNDIKMWEKAWNHEVVSLFQMEQPSGIQGIALTKPKSVDDLAVLNSVIRLMAQEKGGEQPLNKYARFKTNPNLWYQEMSEYGLNREEQKVLEPIVGISYGICESQEKFMQLVQLPECGGFDLTFADKLRKSIAKKNPAEYDKLTKIFFEETAKKGCSARLCNYVWNVLIATSRGYGFRKIESLYSNI